MSDNAVIHYPSFFITETTEHKDSVIKPSIPIVEAMPCVQDGLKKYIIDIQKFPLLSAQEEMHLAGLWQKNQDIQAAHSLITSYLRLVVAIASKYKGYGLPILDLIAEGNLGLMQAVKKFDASKGFRLATYAMWWIKAFIQDYILRSWSLVKIGTTAAQKKLFFGLNKAKKKIAAFEGRDLRQDEIIQIAESLNVPDYEVQHMNHRLGGADMSLNVPLLSHQGDSYSEAQDFVIDERDNQEIMVIEQQEEQFRKKILQQALKDIPEREKQVLIARRLTDPPVVLEELAQKLSVSRERIRQIEARAYERLKQNVQNLLAYHKPKLLTAE